MCSLFIISKKYNFIYLKFNPLYCENSFSVIWHVDVNVRQTYVFLGVEACKNLCIFVANVDTEVFVWMFHPIIVYY